jgi:aerobic C4-dicarboxylate transport protein
MVIGVVLGHFAPRAGQAMQLFGDAFIRLIRMLIAPIVFCTVVLRIAQMNDMSRVGKVALKSLVGFEILTTIALVVALVIVNLWHPGRGMNINSATLNTGAMKTAVDPNLPHGIVAFLMDIIPSTLVGSFADGNVLQVLLISVILGSALVVLRDYGKPLINVLEVTSKVLFGAVNIVMWATPLGAFGAIAFTLGKYGLGSLISLGNLLVCFWLVCLVFIFVVLAPLSKMFGIPFFKLMHYLREETLICLATTSSEVVLPRLLLKMENLGCRSSIVGLVIPTGYSFNLAGTCLYLATSAIFLAQATNTPLPIYQQLVLLMVLLLTSKGSAGVSGAAFVVLALLASDIPADITERDALLLRLMGSPDARQIDGLGGADSLTSKVAVISKSRADDADVDFLFAQVGIDKALVDTKPNCGKPITTTHRRLAFSR